MLAAPSKPFALTLAADLLSARERLDAAATWRGIAVQLRGGTARQIGRMADADLRELAREVQGTPPGPVAMDTLGSDVWIWMFW